MPIYDYKCPDCGDESERLVGVDDRDHQYCDDPQCYSDPPPLLTRVTAINVSAHFRGPGFHRTDYDSPEGTG